jgi:hypothetical protein
MAFVDRPRLSVVQVVAGTATVIAGGLLVFGAFQPWDLQRARATCVAIGHTGMESEGQITVGFGITALILGGSMLARVRPRLMATLALVLFGVVALIVLAAWGKSHVIGGFFGCPATGVGSGIYISLVAAGLGVIGALLGLLRRRESSPPMGSPTSPTTT